MDELRGEFANDGGEGIGWGEGVDGLGEGDEDGGDAELVVDEVSGWG